MPTLLVLGSKPEPRLPPPNAVDAVACANASGFSAAQLGLPAPALTVMSAVLTDGGEAGRLRIAALQGLATGRLIYFPRRPKGRTALRRLWNRWRERRQRPAVLQRALQGVGYRWGRFEPVAPDHFVKLIGGLTGDDAGLNDQMRRKHPSSGIMALAAGIADGRWDRFVVAGFSFELTQAFAPDPNIARRGTARSLHGDTDVLVLAALAARLGTVFTTEPVVAERAGVPLL